MIEALLITTAALSILFALIGILTGNEEKSFTLVLVAFILSVLM